MGMREKLIELIREGEKKIVIADLMTPEQQKEYIYSQLADHLIANGLAVQRWIPVTERLPEANGYYLCVVCVSAVNQRKEYRRMILFWEDNVWIEMANCFRTKKPLYWMPLPDPPKGE